jgi:hypothetical protein
MHDSDAGRAALEQPPESNVYRRSKSGLFLRRPWISTRSVDERAHISADAISELRCAREESKAGRGRLAATVCRDGHADRRAVGR